MCRCAPAAFHLVLPALHRDAKIVAHQAHQFRAVETCGVSNPVTPARRIRRDQLQSEWRGGGARRLGHQLMAA